MVVTVCDVLMSCIVILKIITQYVSLYDVTALN